MSQVKRSKFNKNKIKTFMLLHHQSSRLSTNHMQNQMPTSQHTWRPTKPPQVRINMLERWIHLDMFIPHTCIIPSPLTWHVITVENLVILSHVVKLREIWKLCVLCRFQSIWFMLPLMNPRGLGYLKSPSENFLAGLPWSNEQQVVLGQRMLKAHDGWQRKVFCTWIQGRWKCHFWR